MPETITATTTLEVAVCCERGRSFAVPKDWLATQREPGKPGGWCPCCGRRLVWNGGEKEQLKQEIESLASRLQRSRGREENYCQQLHQTERRLAAQKGVATKLCRARI